MLLPLSQTTNIHYILNNINYIHYLCEFSTLENHQARYVLD